MSGNLLYKPTTIQHEHLNETEQIEFFVSEDGIESGLSQRAVARLCGFTSPTGLWDNTRNKLGNLLNDVSVDPNKIPEHLRKYQGKVYLNISTNAPLTTNVVDSKAANALIRHFAYYASTDPKIQAVAKYTVEQFMDRGMHNWILEVTHFSQTKETNRLLETIVTQMSVLTDKVSKMQVVVDKWDSLGTYTTIAAPGLSDLVDAYSDPRRLSSSSQLVTVKEWLELNYITLDDLRVRRLQLMVSQQYVSIRRRKPDSVFRTSPGSNVSRRQGHGYLEEDFPILEACLKQVQLT